MTEHIVQKIEEIRQLPEHVRLQYALGAVAICMFFVIGVWILTLKQGFLGMSSEVSTGKDQAKETSTSVRESFPNTDSLRSLKENSESLRVNNAGGNADQFIEGELERNTATPPITNQSQ